MVRHPFLSALPISCSPLTQTMKNSSRTYKKAGGKFNDIFHQHRSFCFRQTRGGVQVPFSSHGPLLGTFRLVIPTEYSLSIGISEATYPFFLTLSRLLKRYPCMAHQFQLVPHDPPDKHRPCFVERLP